MHPDSQYWTAHVRRHLPTLGLRPEREADIIAELAAEFEDAYHEALRSGLDAPEARRHAEHHVRDWTALAAEYRAANTVDTAPSLPPPGAPASFASGLWHDVRYALRSLRLNPAFAFLAIFTLAFGIAGNTAIFTIVDHIALRGLPYPNAHRLLTIEHTKTDQPEVDPWCSIDNFLDLRRRTKSFDTLNAISPLWNVVLTGDGDTERLEALYVSSGFFEMLGVTPAAGRLFTTHEDDRVHPTQVALLSHGFWTRRFAASPTAIGKTIRLDNSAVTIIGVLPANFRWLGEPLAGTASVPDLWMPLAANQLARSPRTVRFLKVTAKLHPSVPTVAAQREIATIGAALTNEFASANGGLQFAAVPLETRTHGPLRPAVYLLLATIGFVLLMASANVANLMLAKVTARTRELSVRIALGATTTRIVRQLLTESAVLATLGAIAGLAISHVLIQAIAAAAPPALLHNAHIAIDARALLFTTAIACLSALLAGIIPAWKAIAGNLATEMRYGRGSTRSHHRVRTALSTAQVAIAIVLLTASGLLLRSLLHVLSIHPGFDAERVVSISTQLPPDAAPRQRTTIYNAIRDALLATPGVTSVGAVSRLPMLGQNLGSQLHIEGQPVDTHPPEVEYRAATASYFTTMGIPLQAGSMFEDRDTPTRLELIIDSLTAQRFFPATDPIGKRVRFLADRNGPWFTIIGVVGATRHFGLEADPRPTIYRHTSINPLGAPIFVIRTAADPTPLTQTLARTVRQTHGNMPTYNIFSMRQLIHRSTAQRRFLMWLVSAFAGAALLLAAIGVYGAISQSVLQRTREIGVRVALGATTTTVLRMVFAEGLRILTLGSAIGLFVAWCVATLGRNLLFQVRPYDPLVFLASFTTIALCAALACFLPARRATHIRPLEALRNE